MAGTFEDFLDALLAFESGWDRERYDAGIITDAQLDTWARGSVEDYFPNYASWSELSDAEWETMAYRSLNSFGFVGYQFGEALLIDLGYYDDDVYYGNGASTITWDGTWTGKNGVTSLEDFMTKDAQDVAIREAFGHNLGIIEDGLAAAGKSLDDYLGTTINSVGMSLTGVLASAHLRGAPATVELLLNGTLSNDEYGTSILQYMEQFGGFDAPEVDELIAYFEDRLTGDEGLNNDNNGSADVTGETADVVIDWAWGSNEVVSDFDAAADTIYVGWFTSQHIDISEVNGSVVFSIPSNNQTTTLQGVSLADLSASNFTIADDSAAEEILALVGQDGDSDTGGSGDTGDTGDPGDTGDAGDGSGDGGGSGNGSNGNGDSYGNGSAQVTAATATVAIDWAWGSNEVVSDFDAAADTIYIGWFTSQHIDVSESSGSVVFSVPSNSQTVTLEGVSLSDLTEANFTIRDDSAAQEILALVGDGSDAGNGSDGGGDTTDPGDDAGGGGTDAGDTNAGDGVQDAVHLTWNWAATEVVSDFAPLEDVLDFGSLPAGGVAISESNGDLLIEVVGNGGHAYVIENVQAEDLTLANLSAAHWNDAILEGPDGVIAQLQNLGNDDIA
jgi:hypothetical protein